MGDCDLSDDFRVLRFFHQGSPNLEKVTLRHCKVLHCSLVFTSFSYGTNANIYSSFIIDLTFFNLSCPHRQFPGDYDSEDNERGTRKLDKTSSSDCCGLDFLRNENVELEIIHKNDNDACRFADELVLDLPPNPKGATDVFLTLLLLLLKIRCLIQLELGLVGELGTG